MGRSVEDVLQVVGHCSILRPLFEGFDTTVTPQLIYLGLTSNFTPLTGLYSAFFTILWKFIMISFTKVDTDNQPFNTGTIMQSTVRRLITRIEAYAAEFSSIVERYRSRGEETPSHYLRRYNKHLQPLASLTDAGRLVYSESLRNMFETYDAYPQGAPAYSKDPPQGPPTSFTRIAHFYLDNHTPAKWAAQMLQSSLDEEHEAMIAAHDNNYLHVAQVRRRRSRAT